MAYTKQSWVNGVSPASANRMNHIEEGIAAALEKEDADATYAPVSRALPAGGSAGQVPVKTGGSVVWQDPPSSGGPVLPALPAAATACEMLARMVDFKRGSGRAAIAGDSALNDGGDPPRKLLLWLKEMTDGIGLSERLWNNTTSVYGAPIIVEPGVGTPDTGGTILTDNFNRTAAELVGSTTSGGQVWAGGAGAWSANGTRATANSGTLGLGFNTGAKAMTATADLLLVTTAATPAQQARIAVGCTQANFGAGGSYVWAQIQVTTAGLIQVSLWKRISGTSTQIGTTTTINGVTANSATPQAVRVKLDIAIQALTLTLTVGGVDQVITGSVTEGDTAILGTHSGIAFAANAAGAFGLDEISMAIPFTPGTPGDGLEIWNGAVAGTTLAHQQANLAAMYPSGTHFDWILVSGGHNHGTQEPAAFLAVVDSFIEAFKAAHPETLIIISSQNPQFAPSTTIAAHARRQAALRAYAMENGYEYLPVFEAFTAQADGGASLVNPADGIHPTVSTTTDLTTWCGNLLWIAVWITQINARRAGQTALTALPAS